MRFFDLISDVYVPRRWYLKAPRGPSGELDPRIFVFSEGETRVPSPLTVTLRRRGRPMDWTEGDGGMPVASARVAAILKRLAADDVQLIPVRVESTSDLYFIVKVLRALECVDEDRSVDVRRFGEDAHPALRGKYEVIHKLVIHPEKAEGHHLFRVKDWEMALIASQEIKDAFEHEGIVGALFLPVT